MFPNNYRSIWTHLYDTPHRLHWVDAGGLQTRCLEAGEPGAPVVLMLHGTSGSLENFSANIKAYAEHFHVYAIDMIGSGLTDKPDYDYLIPTYVKHAYDFLAAVGAARISIVGVSLGSWVAARFALAHPDLVDRIVSVAAAGIVSDEELVKATRAGLRDRRGRAAADPSWENVKAIFDNLILLPENRIDDIIAIRWAIYQNPDMPKIMDHVFAMLDGTQELVESEWRSLDKPLLLITAPDHPDLFYKNAEAIAALVPGAQVAPISKVNHWAQFENPHAFNDISIAFLRQGETR